MTQRKKTAVSVVSSAVWAFKKAFVDSKIKTEEKRRMLLVSSLKRCVDFIGLECLEDFGWSTPVNVPPWGASVSASLKEDRMFMGVRVRRSPRSFGLWKQKMWDWFKFPPFREPFRPATLSKNANRELRRGVIRHGHNPSGRSAI